MPPCMTTRSCSIPVQVKSAEGDTSADSGAPPGAGDEPVSSWGRACRSLQRGRPAAIQGHGPEQLRLGRLVQQDRLDGTRQQLGNRSADRQPEPGSVARGAAAAGERRSEADACRDPSDDGSVSGVSAYSGSSGLFRMASATEVQRNLQFLNTGAAQVPGLIAMRLKANGGDYGQYRDIVVFFNATKQQQSFASAALTGLRLHLHPVQRASSDPALAGANFDAKTGTATVPPLTTAVFVRE